MTSARESTTTEGGGCPVGPGGKQIQIEDPDGNPIELFEPQR